MIEPPGFTVGGVTSDMLKAFYAELTDQERAHAILVEAAAAYLQLHVGETERALELALIESRRSLKRNPDWRPNHVLHGVLP